MCTWHRIVMQKEQRPKCLEPLEPSVQAIHRREWMLRWVNSNGGFVVCNRTHQNPQRILLTPHSKATAHACCGDWTQVIVAPQCGGRCERGVSAYTPTCDAHQASSASQASDDCKQRERATTTATSLKKGAADHPTGQGQKQS